MFVFIIFSGVGFSKHLLLLPIIIFVQYILTLAINFLLSAITVFVHDVDHFVSVALTLGFYATPIVYLSSMLPAKFQWAMAVNPMAVMVEAYRAVLFYHEMPNLHLFGIWTVLSFVLLILNYTIFKKLEKSFVEEL